MLAPRMLVAALGAVLAFAAPAPAAAPPPPAAAEALPPDEVLRTTRFADQSGRSISLGAFAGKTVLLGFFVTSGPTRTICDAVAGKFVYLQAHLDPRRYHLLLVTLEPEHDTPAAIRSYARVFGADPARWSVAGGAFNEIVMFDWYFELASPMHVGPNGHAELIEIIDGGGRFRGYLDVARLTPAEIAARLSP